MASGVRVFISSTCQDLEQDCRPAAIEAAGLVSLAVTMEKWITDFANSVQVCKQQIEGESTHYIGIFAHRRGWVPDDDQIPAELRAEVSGKSITEAEFDWALRKLQQKMAIFLPRPATPFDLELRQRASNQSAADAQAQEAFRNRVRNLGCTCSQFDKPSQLGNAIAITVYRWSSPLREQAQVGTAVPDRTALTTLGRIEQTRKFEDCLRDHVSTALPEIACFLIHGPAGYGHDELLNRLHGELEGGVDVLLLDCIAGASWRSKDIAAMFEVLSMRLGEKIASVGQLADRLKQEMTIRDVVLRFDNLQGLNISLSTFIEEFWRPLAQSFNQADKNLAHRLIGIGSFKGVLDATLQSQLFDLEGIEAFNPARLIALPELNAFTTNELFAWLKQQKMPPPKAKEVADSLMKLTKGDPPSLFQEILNEAIWKD